MSKIYQVELITNLLDFILHIDTHLSEIIKDYQVWTYLILFIIIFAETGFVVVPFLPGDSLLIAAGAIIGVGDTGLNIYLLAILLLVGAVLGNFVNYELGRVLGVRVFKVENKILKLEYYLKTQVFFEKHGAKAIVIGRFLPIFRTVVPFVAGIGKLDRSKYNFYNIVGAVAWIGIFLFAGYFLGNTPFFKKNFTLIMLAIIIFTILPPIYAVFRAKYGKND